MDVKELSQISGPPEAHWYYAAKFDLLAATVRAFGARRIVDVGAGSGVFARLLLERTDCHEATCVDPAYERDHDETVNGKILRFRRGYEGQDFDLILLMDVLEHVDDDVALLSDVVTSVRPGAPLSSSPCPRSPSCGRRTTCSWTTGGAIPRPCSRRRWPPPE